MVGAVYDPGVVQFPERVERVDHLADLLVHQRDGAQVVPDALAHEVVRHGLHLRMGLELLHLCRPNLVRGPRHGHVRQGDVGVGVMRGPGRVVEQRNVRLHEAQVEIERLPGVARPQPVDRVIGNEAGQLALLRQHAGLAAFSRLHRTGPAVIVRLADRRGLVAAAPQLLHDRRPGGFERTVVHRVSAASGDVVGEAEFMRVAPGDHGGPARHAHRTLRPGPLKAHAPLRQPVQVRRAHQRMTGTAEHVVAVLIAEHEQDIGLPGHRPFLPHTAVSIPWRSPARSAGAMSGARLTAGRARATVCREVRRQRMERHGTGRKKILKEPSRARRGLGEPRAARFDCGFAASV